MAKPNNLFRWATGASAVAEPAEAKKTQGWIFAERPPPRVMNWLFNGAYQWFSYLNNIHAEPEFLNEDFYWGPAGFHRHHGGVHMYILGLETDPFYINALGEQVMPTRTVCLSMGHAGLGPNTRRGQPEEILFESPLGYATFALNGIVPSGAVITSLTVGMAQTAGASPGMRARIERMAYQESQPFNFFNAALTTFGEVSLGQPGGGEIHTGSAFSTPPVDWLSYRWALVVKAGGGATALNPDRLYEVRIQFQDPGPGRSHY